MSEEPVKKRDAWDKIDGMALGSSPTWGGCRGSYHNSQNSLIIPQCTLSSSSLDCWQSVCLNGPFAKTFLCGNTA